MSSKSKARLPREPLISMRMAFLRPLAKRVASKTPSAPPRNSAEEDGRVVDRDRSRVRCPAVPDSPECSRGQRPLLDEGLAAGRRRVAMVSPVMNWVRSMMWAPMSPSAPEPALSFSRRHDSGASGSTIQSWRYCARTWCRVPRRPSATSWRARPIAGHPAVGEPDHGAHAARGAPSRPPRPSPRPPRRCWPAASRTARACPPRARRSRSRRGCRRGCRCRPGRCRRAATSALPRRLGRLPAEPRRRPRATCSRVAAGDARVIRGRRGRSKKRGAVRQAWEWAAPMKA